eukprot:TRINITY_DN4031_c0_g1_i4.p1 TRINITY_DN4031_c0_g1~~TRINITY_DN4031_c0_g1_i4.p1  ORF type:complete len:238 (-),score=50.69 TRINITY_DN4031_c0_g1_i4:105-782(-)
MSNTSTLKRELQISPELFSYILDVSVKESDVQRRLRDETANHPRAGMQISIDEGQFLAFLVKLLGAVNCIEIGVFTGYSSLSVAQALPHDGKIIACDVSEEYTSIARRYWAEANVQDKIDLRIAPAVDTLDKLIKEGRSGTFDFIFIDADKENYVNYYERGLNLLRRGGVMAVDNVLWHGQFVDQADQSVDTKAIRAVNERIKNDQSVDITMLPMADGITLVRKK